MYDIDSIVLLCILFLLCFLMSSCSTYATLLNSVRFTDLIRFRFLFFFFFLWPKPGRMLYYLIRKFYNNARTSCNRMANYLNGFSFVVIAISSSFTISLCLSISSLPPKLLKPNAFGLVFPRMTCMTCPIYQYFIILYITFTYRLYV